MYQTVWTNPRPEVLIATLAVELAFEVDRSSASPAAPLMAGITAGTLPAESEN